MAVIVVNNLTLADARAWLSALPVEFQAEGRRALAATWGDGFGCGVARLPAANPFAAEPAPSSELEQPSRTLSPVRGRLKR